MKQKVAHITQQQGFGMMESLILEILETFLAYVCPAARNAPLPDDRFGVFRM